MSTVRTPAASGAATRRSVDAYRGSGGRTSGGLTGRRTGSGSGSGSGNKAGKVRGNTDSIRYGHGPVRRLTEPRGSTSRAGSLGNSGKAGKARGASSAVGNVSDRVRRNLQGAQRLDASRPGTSDRIQATGRAIDRAQEGALRASVGSVGGLYRSPYRGGSSGGYDNNGYHDGNGSGYGYYSPYCSPWGFSYYGSSWSFSIGFGSYYYPCYSYWWPYYVSCWYPYYYNYYRPYSYYAAYPAYYSSEVYRTVYVDETAAYEEEPIVAEQARRTPVPNSLSIAADRYLTLGDRAFREGRYTDAVQFYAKAVEYAPGEGAMYLVLADALFAAGDYHYGAYAIRRSFDLDPILAQATVDKHDFYSAPDEFDQQIAALELYLVDHPSDRDARLVLALNYSFGGRPAAAVDLLNSAESTGLKDDAAALLILKSAREAQYGVPAGAERGGEN